MAHSKWLFQREVTVFEPVIFLLIFITTMRSRKFPVRMHVCLIVGQPEKRNL